MVSAAAGGGAVRCPSLLAEELSSAAEKVVPLSSHTKSRGWLKVRRVYLN